MNDSNIVTIYDIGKIEEGRANFFQHVEPSDLLGHSDHCQGGFAHTFTQITNPIPIQFDLKYEF